MRECHIGCLPSTTDLGIFILTHSIVLWLDFEDVQRIGPVDRGRWPQVDPCADRHFRREALLVHELQADVAYRSNT